ncbi:hypothetical protein V6N13_093471 [Hibiscus sabdariffa]|uniref:Uncharacterized protein n=1 Tax=Hibiscus sabdariffa TaxID=183260 RepID=A0ABR2BR40_9ROSI
MRAQKLLGESVSSILNAKGLAFFLKEYVEKANETAPRFWRVFLRQDSGLTETVFSDHAAKRIRNTYGLVFAWLALPMVWNLLGVTG